MIYMYPISRRLGQSHIRHDVPAYGQGTEPTHHRDSEYRGFRRIIMFAGVW